MRTPRSPRYIGMTAWIYGAIVIFQAVSSGFALSFGMVIQIMLYISGLPFDCTNHGREDRHFSRPYDLSTFVLTSFVQTEIVQFLLFRLHILTATALQWINDRDAPYRVLLHLSCEIIADCLVFDGCAQIYYFTFALFVSYLHHHSFSYFGSQYRCAKPSLYIWFEFSEWCYYVTTFVFQNHILGLWHGDESWFWHWGHVINMTSSYAMWRWCQYTSEAGYLWTLCNVVDFRDSHHVWVFYALVLFGAFVSSTFYIICSCFRGFLMSCICIDRSWSNIFNDFGACHVHTKAGWLDAEAFYSLTRSIGIGKIVQHATQGSDSLLSYSCKEHLYGLTSCGYWHVSSSFVFDICWWYA